MTVEALLIKKTNTEEIDDQAATTFLIIFRLMAILDVACIRSKNHRHLTLTTHTITQEAFPPCKL